MSKATINQNNKIYSLEFNQNFTLFSLATENGFKIYNTSQINENYEKKLSGGIKKCELSYQSNYIALVGGGKTPIFSNKKVVIYNDAEDVIESEYKFMTPVLNVKLKKNLLFIVCEKTIYVFNTFTSLNIDSFDTIYNKKGLIAVNGNPEKTIMAYPIEFKGESNKGYVTIKNYKTNKCFPLNVQDDKISFMAMDYNGLLLATSNEKGTLIRLHSCNDGTLMYECRRGKEKAEIIYISFDINYKYIGVSSDRKTIHVWKLDNIIERKKKEINVKTSKSFISNDNKQDIDMLKPEKQISDKTLIHNNKNNIIEKKEDINLTEEICLKEIKSPKNESSFAKIRMNEPDCIFCFKPKDNVIIISYHGNYTVAHIDSKKGGDCNPGKTINLNDVKKEKEKEKNNK